MRTTIVNNSGIVELGYDYSMSGERATRDYTIEDGHVVELFANGTSFPIYSKLKRHGDKVLTAFADTLLSVIRSEYKKWRRAEASRPIYDC